MQEWIIGVDEAGRGPLAGPVAVGVARVPKKFNLQKAFPGLDDSKALRPKEREELYRLALMYKKEGTIDFCVRFASSDYIDKFGITRAVCRGVWSGVRFLVPGPRGVRVYLDGLLKAPPEYMQETVIHGDALVPVISLASVIAKVSRDRLMERVAKKYPAYDFDLHKGYATKLHYQKIEEHGLCEVHRKSFCKNIASVV